MDENLFIRKAYEAILSHDFEQAIVWFEKAIEEEPSNASYHYRLSISYARSNKIGKAVEYAEQACKLNPGKETYRLHLNSVIARQLLFRAEEIMRSDATAGYREAIFILKRAIQLNPLLVEAMLMLALANEKLGQLDEAWTIIQDAIKLDPHHKEVNQLHARLFKGMKQSH